ncbi:hypothetical protein [Methanoculleus sp.]|jgi:hypothetical protein|uniref:hypothetical protein n=1 Tax=Methanoculleus sp. TaxID=90427 RepID=UPI0025D6031A|nr:hypothetical protein [Methanoculleus sp.]MCK9320235.1 hypothetical protein [Methanoculleus sp.]
MERNFKNIENQSIREKIDPKYNEIHDELSDSFYKHIRFRQFGVLDKLTFDKLHGLIFLMRDVEYYKKLGKEHSSISDKIKELEKEGIILDIK